MPFLDRNAADQKRLRRNAQRFRHDLASNIPLSANSGLVVTGGGLSIKLADTSLKLASTGISINLATNPGLQVSSGLLLKLTDTSLTLGAGGVGVNLASNSGLTISSGLTVLIDGAGTGLSLTGSGLKYTSPVTTKGDLLTFASAPARQAVGSNDTLLVADSTQTNGIKWTGAIKPTDITIVGSTTDHKAVDFTYNSVNKARFTYNNDNTTGVGQPNRNGTYMVNFVSGFYLQIDDAAGSLVYGPNGGTHVFAVYTDGTLEVGGMAGFTGDYNDTASGNTLHFKGGILTGVN